MKVVGEFRAQSQYIFAITTGYRKSRIDVYSYYSQDESSDLRLLPQYLNSKKVTAYHSYLAGSAAITGSGVVTKYHGNLAVVSLVLNKLGDTGLLIDIISGDLQIGEYTCPGCTFEIHSVNQYISTAELLPGVAYVAPESKRTFKLVAAGASRKSVKTFEEVIQTHDMSWYYDDQGKCKKDYRLIQSIEELREVLKDTKGCKYLAFDTETTGTDFYWFKGDSSRRSRICGMSLSWREDQGIYIPFMSNRFEVLDLAEVMKIVYPIMCSMKVVCHNGMFDFRVMYSYGYNIPIAHDTLLMEFNIDPHVKKGSKGLKELTRKYLNHETIELDELTGGRVIPELIPDIEAKLIEVYACSDTDYALRLCKLLYPYVADRPSYQLDCKLISILAIAEYQGTPIDMKNLSIWSKINKKNLETIEKLMSKYLRTVGVQTLALRTFHAVEGDSYNPSSEELRELCNYQPFLDSIEGAFYKQNKKSSKSPEPLQFSAPADITYILYDLLGYPVLATTPDGNRTSNKEALDKLLEVAAVTPVKFLKEDIISCAPDFGIDTREILISKEKFEGYQYPFVYLLAEWRELSKLDTSFFGPLLNGSGDGYYYSDNSMTSAETSRVINKIQTLKGSLKDLVVPRGDDWYMIVFDKSQIEFRVMLGLAANYWHGLVESGVLTGTAAEIAKSKELDGLIENLNNWEKDYHREGGAIFAGCTPDTMTKEQRKKVKAIHFSVPYGAEAASVAKPKLKGVPEHLHSEIIAETEAELSAWRNKLYPLYYFLEHVRDVALTPLEENPPAHEGLYGKVTNAFGRYRLFHLDNLTFKDKSSIRRQAGNYPIQSLARDIFFTGVLLLFNRLKKEGIICDKFEDSKAVLSLFVHDEVVLQVHKSIHPYRMYKYIMETNLTKLKGHPTYFMGIAVANNWGQGKSDKYEAPIDYVNECIQEYETHQEYYDNIGDHINFNSTDYCEEAMTGIKDWFAKRVCRELTKVLEGSNVVDPTYLEEHMINYYVKPRLSYYCMPCRKEEYLEDPSISKEANKMMRYIDSYLLSTGEYKKYLLKFNGEEIPYEQVLVIAQDADESDEFNFNLNFDLEEVSDFDEDYAEKEQLYADEYYLLSDYNISVNTSCAAPDVEEDTLVDEKPSLWSEDTDGNIVFFVSGMSQDQFKRLTNFLKGFVSPSGKKLYFFTTSKVYSGVAINPTFTKEQVYDVVQGTGVTNVFGG